MSTDADVRALRHAAVEAIRRGDAAAARQQFERLTEQNSTDVMGWLGLALACRGLKDAGGTMAAVDKVLALEPRNVRALIMKGDHLANLGNKSSAILFYRGAVKSAQTAGTLPPELANDVKRADEVCSLFARDYEQHLQRRLAARGFHETMSSQRFARSVDLLQGKKQLFLQQPRHYYFPELPQIQFYDRNLFPWLDDVEAATADIRREAEDVLVDAAAFSPYVTEEQKERPPGDYLGMLNNPDWSAFYLYRDGDIIAENAARCPKTCAALNHVPFSRAKRRMPSVLFSLLRAGARIPPHNGMLNIRLICHLPLVVPGNCGLRVGNETRVPVEGKAWVFDDSIDHEAWNLSDRPRLILLFEIWRPELSEDERQLVAALLEAVDAFGASETSWDI